MSKNKPDTKDQLISEDQFRGQVLFDATTKRQCTSPNDQNKRARLDASVPLHERETVVVAPQPLAPISSDAPPTRDAVTGIEVTLSTPTVDLPPAADSHMTTSAPVVVAPAPAAKLALSVVRPAHRFRLRSLPNLLNNKLVPYPAPFRPKAGAKEGAKEGVKSVPHPLAGASGARATSLVPLPPVNLQSLREIDLHEILKNPQLRHDILFDPQLQFRPNLDGERGRRKKALVDRYWADVAGECADYARARAKLTAQSGGSSSPERGSAERGSAGGFASGGFARSLRLPPLFTTLREILLSLLPSKDRAAVNDVMDTELLIQQLNRGTFDFVSLATWLAGVFKSHCAPMRDLWVDDMTAKFIEADRHQTVDRLVEGLRTIFAILEAMKLDVANHQIRVLRPVLVETAVEFERDYFNQMILRGKLDVTDLLIWYRRSWVKQQKRGHVSRSAKDLRSLCVSAILDLLSCRNMVSEFPSSLVFDHARLVLLRADIRQSVCLQLCTALYRQLLGNYTPSAPYRAQAVLKGALDDLRLEILAIITDENGNVKWTRNVGAIALQLTKRAITVPCAGAPQGMARPLTPRQGAPPAFVARPLTPRLAEASGLMRPLTPRQGAPQGLAGPLTPRLNSTAPVILAPVASAPTATPPDSLVEFAFNWLIKQIQPSSEIYKLMEERIFSQLLERVSDSLEVSQSVGAAAAPLDPAQIPSLACIIAPTPTTGPEAPSRSRAATPSNLVPDDVQTLSVKISTLVRFHWSVFGSFYTDYMNEVNLV